MNKGNKLNIFPIPIAGLILGLAALGNLLQSYNETYRVVLGIISGILFILFTLKIITNWELFKEDLKNPQMASILATYSMALIILSTYIKSYLGDWASIVWHIGILLHLIIVGYFCVNFLLNNFNKENIMPSWYVTFVGIAVGGVTGKAFNPELAKITFYIGIVMYFILMPFIVKKVFIKKDIKAPLLPTVTITAAPGGLCLAAYINSFDEKSIGFITFMVIISQIYYLLALVNIPKALEKGFFPSYSAFTFPLIITTLSLKLSNKVLEVNFLNILINFEVIVAVVISAYVLVKYLIFLTNKSKTK